MKRGAESKENTQTKRAKSSSSSSTSSSSSSSNSSSEDWKADIKGKNVLITGGTGYIASHVVVELIEAGAKVTIVDNLSNSNIEVLNHIEEITGVRPAFYKADLCDYKASRVVFESVGFEFAACIHFAGLKAVGESTKLPLMYYENNLLSTINLLKLMEEFNCFNFVFSSSATVYGFSEKMPIVETEPVSATNPYGMTKLIIEQMCQDLATANPKWRIALLRYFNPVGAHPSGLIGEDPLGIPNNLCPYVAQVAIGKREHLTVFGDDYPTPDGTGVRDYIHVVDLAGGHLMALANGVWGKMKTNCEAYNLGTGKGTSVYEVCSAFEKAVGKPIPRKVGPRRTGDVATVFCNPTKAKEELGWETALTFEQAVADAWKWQSDFPDGFRNSTIGKNKV